MRKVTTAKPTTKAKTTTTFVKPTKAKKPAVAKVAAKPPALTPHQIGALRMWAERKAAAVAKKGARKAVTPVKAPAKVAVKKPGKQSKMVLNDYQLRAQRAWKTRRANLLAKGLVKADGTLSRKEKNSRTARALRAWATRRERLHAAA